MANPLRERRPDFSRVPSVVLCNSTVVAQAVARSLGLQHASLATLGDRARENGRQNAPGEPPVLAISIESDVGRVGPAIRALKRKWPRIKIVTVGLTNREDDILRAFAAGADGVVLAEEPLACVAEAARIVLAGAVRPPPQTIQPLFDHLLRLQTLKRRSGKAPAVARLSARELEILSYLRRGDDNKAIAVELHVEVQTVKNHVSNILHKLGVKSRHDAAKIVAVDAGQNA